MKELEDGVLGVGPVPPQVTGAVGCSTGWPSFVTDLPFDSISSCCR